jgi:hypothetical protein
LLATLFPDEFPEQRLGAWAGDQIASLRLGVSLQLPNEQHFKLYRRVARDTVVLRHLDGPGRGQELARGAHKAAQDLRRRHHLPTLRDFLMLHTWDFSDFLRGAVMPGKEQVALEEARLGLPPEDLALVEDFDTRKASIEHRQEQLNTQIEEARQERRRHLPAPWFKNPRTLLGLSASVVCLVLSALIARPIALANLLFLGVAAWSVIRDLEKREAASVYEVRVEQIYLHLEQAGRDISELERHRGRILARVKEEDLGALRDKLIELEDMRQEVARRALPDDKERRRTQKRHAEASAALEDLRGRLAELEARREPLGQIETASYELESMLYDQGVDVADLEQEAPQPAASPAVSRREAGPERDPLDLLFAVTEAAARVGALHGGRLSPKAHELWRRFALHVLGQRFADFEMDAAGRLRVKGMDAQALEGWLAEHPDELPMLAATLAAALMATGAGQAGGRFLCINRDALPARLHARLDKVFGYLGKYLQVVVLEPPAH